MRKSIGSCAPLWPCSPRRSFMEAVFMVSDPNSARRAPLVLGGHCAACGAVVCCDDGCSLFYGKRFCTPCARKHADLFPAQLHKVWRDQVQAWCGAARGNSRARVCNGGTCACTVRRCCPRCLPRPSLPTNSSSSSLHRGSEATLTEA